jgi:hypothetical protein
VTAGEYELEPVVLDRAVGTVNRSISLQAGHPGQDLTLVSQIPLAADAVDCTSASHRGDPTGWVVGDSSLRPGTQCLDQSVLNRLLGQVDVTTTPGDAGHDQGVGRPERLSNNLPMVGG